jgi:hypothetical protein
MFAQSEDVRIHWFQIIVQLKNEGYSLYSVSHFTNIPKSTLIGYKQGSEPKYHDGVRLLEFWAQATSRPRAEAPTVNPFSFKA